MVHRPQFGATEATSATVCVTAANRRAGYPAPRPLARRVPLGSGEPSPRRYPRGALRGLGGTATPDGGHGGNTRRRGPHSSQSSRRVPTPKTVGRLGNCAHCDDFVRIDGGLNTADRRARPRSGSSGSCRRTRNLQAAARHGSNPRRRRVTRGERRHLRLCGNRSARTHRRHRQL
jgi:hypothetical protein